MKDNDSDSLYYENPGTYGRVEELEFEQFADLIDIRGKALVASGK